MNQIDSPTVSPPADSRPEPAPSPGFSFDRIDLLMLLCCVLAWVGQLRTVCVDEAALFASVVIDDALHYLIPAQNFVDGAGFSFDGNHLTGGFQPLWAIVVTGLAALVDDRVAAVRVLVATSGFLWIAGGWILFRGLRRFDGGAALLAGVLWLLTGTWSRMALMGMNDGVYGLLFAALVAWGCARSRRAPSWVWLGVLAGLIGLAHTEAALLVPMLGVAVLLGWLGRDREGMQWRAALRFAVPAALLLGTAYVAHWIYFGHPLPANGSVKLFYESTWDPRFPDSLTALAWHLGHVFEIATYGLYKFASRLSSLWGGEVDHGEFLRAAAIGLGVGAVLTGLRVLIAWRRVPWVVLRFGLVVLAFSAVQLAMFALLLPHFTEYGTWYFAGQLMLVSVLVVMAAASVLPWFRWRRLRTGALLVVAVAIAATDAGMWFRRPRPQGSVNAFTLAGRWAEEHLPGGQRIGTLSSGYFSYAAPSQTVVNLDGLMNDRRYLEEFLRQDRVPDYLRAERIDWFADLMHADAWRHGLSWCGNVPLSEMELCKWWPVDGERAFCIFRLWPGDSEFPADPFSQLQFRAGVLEELGWEASLGEAPGPTGFVATSVASLPTGELRHVIMDWEEYLALGIAPDRVLSGRSLDGRFGGAVRLLGVDSSLFQDRRRRHLVLTRYWQWLDATVDAASLAVITHLGEREIHAGPLAHGTIPAGVPAGCVISDTVRIALDSEMPEAGALWLSLRDGDGTDLTCEAPAAHERGSRLFLGNLTEGTP